MKKYKSTGITILAATQPFGYVAKRQPAAWPEERAYALQIRDEFYPWMKNYPTPVSQELYSAYGVASAPTVVFIDRPGNVANYHPGRLTAEELDAAIAARTASSSGANRPQL